MKTNALTEDLLARWNFTEQYGNAIDMIQNKSGHDINLTISHTNGDQNYAPSTVGPNAWTKK